MAEASRAPTVVAAFDFDHTLTTRDSVVPFLRLAAGRRRLVKAVLGAPWATVTALARRDRNALRAVATRGFTGVGDDELATVAATFASRITRSTLRPDTVERLRTHVAAGHRVVIVSASYENYLAPVADELGVTAVLGTRLDIVDGVCTGALDGANCRGPEKVRRLELWLREVGLERDGVELHAYGDSAGDRELLAWADHATWIDARPIAAALP